MRPSLTNDDGFDGSRMNSEFLGESDVPERTTFVHGPDAENLSGRKFAWSLLATWNEFGLLAERMFIAAPNFFWVDARPMSIAGWESSAGDGISYVFCRGSETKVLWPEAAFVVTGVENVPLAIWPCSVSNCDCESMSLDGYAGESENWITGTLESSGPFPTLLCLGDERPESRDIFSGQNDGEFHG